MTDWRGQVVKSQLRQNQLSGDGTNTGIFQAYIDSATGNDQSGKFVYAGGERSISLQMPFDSSTSWIRCIPESGTSVLATYRSDTQDLIFLNYTNCNPKQKLDAYDGGINLYRSLLPGEIEIHSTGLAQTYYSARPVLEQRAGLVRSWLDQDRLESGAKAPLHSRYLWEHKSSETGDEEHFGAVRRPYNFSMDPTTFEPRNPLAAILALSETSSNYFDYPTPGFSIPATFPNPLAVAATAAAATAAAAGLLAIGEFKQRIFAKEHLRVLKNPFHATNPASNALLFDFREGQVFDDKGVQTPGSNGAYLRAKYNYYTPALDATTIEIDEFGNIDWSLSVVATAGFNVVIPTGKATIRAALDDIDFTTGKDVNVISTRNTGFTVGGNFSAGVAGDTTYTVGGNFKSTVKGDYTISAPIGNYSADVQMNYGITAGIDTTIKAKAGKLTLYGPKVDIGITPAQSMILGDLLASWLKQLVGALRAAQPIGNVGAPVPLISDIVFANQLVLLDAAIEPLKSTTIKVSP